MPTQLNYMSDFNVETCSAKVIAVTQLEDGRVDVELDQTCFYPRGGGQDWDKGVIKGQGGTFSVEEVRLDDEGVVHHIGHLEDGTITAGQEVNGLVDHDRRELNSRIHSAGHLVDLAVEHIGLTEWVPGRGAHYPDMSFVEYSGEWNVDEAERIREQIENEVNKLVSEGGDNEIKFMPKEEMHAFCRFVPDYVPTNKPGRIVIYHGNFGVPCGGTHVKNLHEIGKVSITKVKKKDKAIRVSYAL